jgi:hypothetical protein
MTGIFSVLNYPVVILFDSGASHSFISTKFSSKCQLPFHHTNGGIMIATPGGRVATYQLNRHVPIKLGSLIFKTTLLSWDWRAWISSWELTGYHDIMP